MSWGSSNRRSLVPNKDLRLDLRIIRYSQANAGSSGCCRSSILWMRFRRISAFCEALRQVSDMEEVYQVIGDWFIACDSAANVFFEVVESMKDELGDRFWYPHLFNVSEFEIPGISHSRLLIQSHCDIEERWKTRLKQESTFIFRLQPRLMLVVITG